MSLAKFTSGSILRHILVMTLTSTVGLIAIFFVDLADMYFLSLLGEKEITAAIGFGTTLLFFLMAICLGCQVSAGAAIARAEGLRDRALSLRRLSHALVFTTLVTTAFSLLVWWYCRDLLALLGAKGKTLDYATQYSRIVILSTPLLALGFASAASLRSLGDAKRSMIAISSAAVINGILDPILILGLDMGITGAAWGSVFARVGIVSFGLYGLRRGYNFSFRLQSQALREDFSVWWVVALPAMLTNLATPVGSSIVMRAMAPFGDEAVSAVAIVGRVAPLAFALLFSLSGAIGPIIGQNMAANMFARVKEALRLTLLLVVSYVLVMWLLLALGSDLVIGVFSAAGLTAELITFYTHFVVLGFIFNALLFVANAALNNLYKAHMATVFNFSRSLLGILPAVILLAPLYGAKGVMAAEAVGQVVFGVLAYWYVWRLVNTLEQQHCQQAH